MRRRIVQPADISRAEDMLLWVSERRLLAQNTIGLVGVLLAEQSHYYGKTIEEFLNRAALTGHCAKLCREFSNDEILGAMYKAFQQCRRPFSFKMVEEILNDGKNNVSNV